MKMMKCKIENIHRGNTHQSQHIVYAELRDEKNVLMVGGTLEYIMQVCEKGKVKVTNWPEVITDLLLEVN